MARNDYLNDLPKLHPREQLVIKKEAELAVFLAEFQGELTTAEYLRVLASALGSAIGSIAKYAIREERHGNTTDPGGLE